jgi:hypothetical protein
MPLLFRRSVVVRQWYGEMVGFGNGDTLVSWTANVQGWTVSHSMFDFNGPDGRPTQLLFYEDG